MATIDWKTRITILTLAHVVGTLHIVSVMAMAPVIQADLGLSVTQVGLLVTGYYAAQTVGAVPAGAFSDRVGVGYALVISQLLLIAGTLIFNQAPGFTLAIAGTVVMGFGYSIVNPATAKGVLEWFPIRRRATAMGVKQTGVRIGGVLAAGPDSTSCATCGGNETSSSSSSPAFPGTWDRPTSSLISLCSCARRRRPVSRWRGCVSVSPRPRARWGASAGAS